MEYYSIQKYDAKTDKMIADYGGGYEIEDIKAICKGYQVDLEKGIAFRSNGKYYYFIEKE